MLALTVPPDAVGIRLDRFLAELEEVGSRASAERHVAAGRVTVDGRVAGKALRLRGGEQIEVSLEDPGPGLEPVEMALAVPFEDEYLLVVDKPAGLVVHPGAGHASGTLVDALAGKIAGGEADRPGIVHRLDRDTSGLMVVARSPEAHERLQELVREHGLERIYLALVRGTPRSLTGRIEAPIGRDRSEPTRVSLDTDSPRDAVTHFEVERQLAGHTLLRVRLETGRMHQIRVHLGAIDLPVVGDPVYGIKDPGLGRQFLHAAELSFTHPFTAERIESRSELPADLAAYLAELA
jgi:23S rRNA pseudouridine1911/1915/1917 synthase